MGKFESRGGTINLQRGDESSPGKPNTVLLIFACALGSILADSSQKTSIVPIMQGQSTMVTGATEASRTPKFFMESHLSST